MADYLGLTSVDWGSIFNSWWDRVLAGIILATVTIGSAYILFLLVKRAVIQWRINQQSSRILRKTARYFETLQNEVSVQSSERNPVNESKSLGVFLGSFSTPPTGNQVHLLTQWDVIILDPFQNGVLDAISSECTATHIVARFDVGMILDSTYGHESNDVVQSLDIIVRAILGSLKRPQDLQSRFTGVLLTEWSRFFSPIALNELLEFLVGIGLDVNLEISPTITSSECQPKGVKMELVSGLVVRNGTILSDGSIRNYFQGIDMRVTSRALAQASQGRSIVMMWDTVDDDVKVEHAVIKRSFTLCDFSSAICWIGTKASLTNSDIAVKKTIVQEPLGALMWLKDDNVITLHDKWRLNGKICQNSNNNSVYDSLQSFIPNLSRKLALTDRRQGSRPFSQASAIQVLEWPLNPRLHSSDPLSISQDGEDYTGMGCFQLGLESSWQDVGKLIEAQRHLRDLKLLKSVTSSELHRIGYQLETFVGSLGLRNDTSSEGAALRDLINLISEITGDEHDRLKVFLGMDTGFHTDTGSQFWGFYDVEPGSDVVHLYISAKAKDLRGTILHTFMSGSGLSRAKCFLTEVALAAQCEKLVNPWNMPERIIDDIKSLSPSEALLLSRRLTLSSCEEYRRLSFNMLSYCEYHLLDRPSLLQLNDATTRYLSKDISAEQLVSNRIQWYHEQGCHCPDTASAISLFNEINTRLPEVLQGQDRDTLSQLEFVFRLILEESKLDASADLFALSVFCAFRRLALDEVYFEVLDRNPLPNGGHPDQAACFAEMFATGSQCESYFSTTPNRLGAIISGRYQKYYTANQPPPRDDLATELPTAYSSKQVDLDHDAKPAKLPLHYQITFLGVFALPALVDITLLTTLGRGLYLTTYMSGPEKSMATAALMVSLLLCGAIGTWISSGGTYYLHSMAFAAMNMFVLTRLIAGMAVCIAAGFLAFLILGAIKGFYAGFIFMVYLFILTTYLSLLATLSIYQIPGFQFQSGRTTIILCIPILFISPILTLWVHNHDILIYLVVLISFLSCLFLGTRNVIAKWSTWYLHIPCVTDAEVANWFSKSESSIRSQVAETGRTMPLPRKILLDHVLQERNRRFWIKPTSDDTVMRLAKGYPATVFMMDWYCRYSRTKMPYPYSPTWNLQCKAAVDTLKDMQKGIKLHNAFVHWREAGDEVWCGVLYFVIALLDKWVALITGGSLIGLSAADSATYRLAVGFGLAYYLLGAICLDSAAQPLWILANKALPQSITSLGYLRNVAMTDAQTKQRLYWKSLFKFLLVHVWGLCVTATLMLCFNKSKDGMILYLSYVGAYTGLLWYQYNRVFTGPLVLKDLMVSVAVGLLVGPILHYFRPHFPYYSVISLTSASWTAAFLSLWTAKIGVPKFRDEDETYTRREEIYHCNATLDLRPPVSQTTLSNLYDFICDLPQECHFVLDPAQYPGVEIMDILMSNVNSEKLQLVQSAFCSGEQTVKEIAVSWRRGDILVELIPAQYLTEESRGTRVVSRNLKKQLHVIVFISPDRVGGEWITDIQRNCKVIAECIIQTTLESRYGMSRDHSAMAEVLAGHDTRKLGLFIPEGVRRLLQNSESDRHNVLATGKNKLLRYILFGLESDTEWDLLPRNTRQFLLKRCCGETGRVPDDQLGFIRSRFSKDKALSIDEYVSRCYLGANLSSQIYNFAKGLETDMNIRFRPEPPQSLLGGSYFLNTEGARSTIFDVLKESYHHFKQYMQTGIKFVVVPLVADPEYQRELEFLIGRQPAVIRWPMTAVLNGIWIYCKALQKIVLPIFLFHGRKSVSDLYRSIKSLETRVSGDKVTVEGLEGRTTGFFTILRDGDTQLRFYSGDHKEEPSGTESLVAINNYTDELILRRREEYKKDKITNIFLYEYDPESPFSKQPVSRHCIEGTLYGQAVQYDRRGFIVSGSFLKNGEPVNFTYRYRENSKYIDELLRAEYSLPHIDVKVAWSVPPAEKPEKLDTWVPHPKVMQATFVQGADFYSSIWTYDHKFHPSISTTLNQQPVPTPPMIEHDWFDLLKRPEVRSFEQDNPLDSFNTLDTSIWSRLLRRNVKHVPLSVSQARTHLWKSWKQGKTFDAVTMRWLDEMILRSAPILKPYWRARDIGQLWAGEDYILDQADNITAHIDLDEISSWTPLAFKLGDLRSFGQGGDSRINTRTQSTQLYDTSTSLNILAMDTGTWPNESGGVSACRRDMVNNLQSIKWHVMAESANDFGVPRFQIEKNVQSLTVLPLWGLDFLTPIHGIFEDCLQVAVQQKSYRTIEKDITDKFLPILTILVRCARAVNLNHQILEEAAKALIDLNTYFESRHWGEVWMSDIVKRAWIDLWLTEDMENTRPISEWLNAECPTLLHLQNALDMWHRYLFIFSVSVPDEIPDVFQASHHFAGASYGVICKLKRRCSLQVWDHCISWREVTVFLSSAMSGDSPFVCTSLMSLSRVLSVLILHHADVILPCADFFNPGWEVELGTQQGTLGHRHTFARKIDPVVNGICDMEKFKPIEEVKSKVPTVIMLSHIRFVKDIKNASLAADIIVNKWGFKDYRLEIYGDMEKAPTYAVECQEIIAAKGLRDHVILRGLGDPAKALQDAWMFLNSSVSEGLPLAMGEAALAGVPVVCTDVGASFRVVTDPATGKRFSAVVAPNDALSLARAQVNVLALLDEWAEFADDEDPNFRPKLSAVPSPQEVDMVAKRMYAKVEQRRRLGMMGRTNVQTSFSEERYLREHEQMLWIGKHKSESYAVKLSEAMSRAGRSSFASTAYEKH